MRTLNQILDVIKYELYLAGSRKRFWLRKVPLHFAREVRGVSCTIFIGFSAQYRDANCNCRVVKYIQYTIHWPGSSAVHRGLGNALVLKHLISRRRKGIKDHWGIFLLATSGNLQRRIFPIALKTQNFSCVSCPPNFHLIGNCFCPYFAMFILIFLKTGRDNWNATGGRLWKLWKYADTEYLCRNFILSEHSYCVFNSGKFEILNSFAASFVNKSFKVPLYQIGWRISLLKLSSAYRSSEHWYLKLLYKMYRF